MRPKAISPWRNLAAAVLALTCASSAIARTPKSDDRGELQLSKLLAGRMPGKPTDCIALRSSQDTQIIDHTAIIYGDGGTLWVNRPVAGRESLDDDAILVTKLNTSELCSIDPIYILDRFSHFERGFVSLGKFVPYTTTR
jgi:hypothetical protein